MTRWQDDAAVAILEDDEHPVRRSGVGGSDIRYDGLRDLLAVAQNCSILDVGCNRGHIGYEFYRHGARRVDGCDVYAPGILAARQWFAELEVESRFEVVDLEKGPGVMSAAFPDRYDIVLLVGVQHKLKRVMPPQKLVELITHLGNQAITYLGWNGYVEDIQQMDEALAPGGLKRVHTSELALLGRPAAIWRRGV